MSIGARDIEMARILTKDRGREDEGTLVCISDVERNAPCRYPTGNMNAFWINGYSRLVHLTLVLRAS